MTDQNPSPILHFLIADDHTPTRASLRQMVATHPGWQVIAEAGDGVEALALTTARRPNVVLMDVVMPEMNGFQATQRIKTLTPETKVILFSAHPNRGFRQHSREVGADFFLQKEELTTQALEKIVAEIF